MVSFCFHSILRPYGWRFLWRVALPHPVKTARALAGLRRLEDTGERMDVPAVGVPACSFDGTPSLVGVGFCLKPFACPSGRFNHDCRCLEVPKPERSIPACCRICEIRSLGEAALKAGAAFYIMTSARDILYDVFVPALRDRRFTSALFLLCRYSFQPFALGMMVAGIRGSLHPFATGDCRDYRTWHRADGGIKGEQTAMSAPVRQMFRALLRPSSRNPRGDAR